MEIKVRIPFQELVALVRQLSPAQKARLRKELTSPEETPVAKSRLTELLLKGPVFSDEQIQALEETRKSINPLV